MSKYNMKLWYRMKIDIWYKEKEEYRKFFSSFKTFKENRKEEMDNTSIR